METVRLHQILTYFKTSSFHPMVFHFYLSLVCVVFIIDITPGVRPIVNQSGNWNACIIEITSPSWDEPHLLSNYSMVIELILFALLFSSATLVLNPYFSKQIGMLVVWDTY